MSGVNVALVQMNSCGPDRRRTRFLYELYG